MKALTARKIGVAASDVWKAVRGIGRLEVWFPTIVACRVEGAGVGARRFLTFDRNRGEAEDHIVEVDDDRRLVVYRRVRSPFPVSSYVGTVEVLRSFDGLAAVTWTVDFVPTQEDGTPLKLALEEAIGAALRGMEMDLTSR